MVDDQYGNPADAEALATFLLSTAQRWAPAKAGDPALELFHFTKDGATPRYAVTDLRFHERHASAIAGRLKPSTRGGLEIADVNRAYL